MKKNQKSVLSHSEPTDSERLFFDPENYFNRQLDDINAAKKEIFIEVYIFRLDSVGLRFIEALKAADQRGVEVRLLIDGVGSYYDAADITQMFSLSNCQIRIFHPTPWDFNVYRHALTSGRFYSQLLYFIANINRRNHRKICVIDSHIAWLGSFNITAEHFNNTMDDTSDDWHDTGVRIVGDRSLELKNNFETVWQRKIETPSRRTRTFFSNHSRRQRKEKNDNLLSALCNSKEKIWITNAYFNPSKALISALKAAAQKSVCVSIIVPACSDIIFFPFISRSYYADLLNAGIRVYEYKHKVLHSKTILIDNAAFVGSTNLNFRSLFHDLELDASVDYESNIALLEEKFKTDLKNCSEITLKSWQRYPLLLKVVGWLSRFLRYWL